MGETDKTKRMRLLANSLSILSHPIRLSIMSYLARKESASWTELFKELENERGYLNPNTLNFHLTKLLDGGLIKKKGEHFTLAERAKREKIITTILSELEV